MRADKRSAEARSPGSFPLVPTFQQHSAAYVPDWYQPWYAPPAGSIRGRLGSDGFTGFAGGAARGPVRWKARFLTGPRSHGDA
jgi:hypothetical protein